MIRPFVSRFFCGQGLAIDVSAMTDFDDKYDEDIVLYLIDDAIVSDSSAKELQLSAEFFDSFGTGFFFQGK